MNEVFIAGRALASALGPDLGSAMAALPAGAAPVPVTLADGSSWPCYAIDDDDTDWTSRSRRLVERAAAEAGATDRTGALFIASSSLDIGLLEATHDFDRDHQAFADSVAGWLGWQGPVYTVSTACTSGLNALLSARTLVRHGVVPQALVLGLELRNTLTLGGFAGMQLLSHSAALPYGLGRNGLVLGEAVAALQLSAQPSRWRLAGGANVVDGRDPAGSIESAVIDMCHQALADSALTAHDIGLVKPQAAGGAASDATEARALRQVFDPLPPLVSFKAAIGHTLGASGVAEIALLTACLESGAWPRADHAQDPALQAPLAKVPPSHARHVLACILGFGGGHTAVVLEDTQA
ncbi:beta-ketoacyl synthase N-terminal-like domain-containing protein [Piscinibacter sp. HJYY11]|uniref:beta-ketoacyl synthase N-terminal-like domain-containing protein n=1 Tax=Piscinibacter sp. HJYY11 TaxID=2801333 RepID=UPI00191F8608|nr:beta-ketoacyl synthase N-terminal-like domain-containing protein [Piscinibacter sp. HJYY11]MBL0730707.1 beta-ketoacyl synthase [Piscinibacter sp. HJYY11]